MSYKANGSLEHAVAIDGEKRIDATERALAIRMAFEIKEKVRRYTPTAVRPPKVSAGVFQSERDNRRPGTLKDSWEIGKPYKIGNLLVIDIYTDDPIAPHVEYDTRPHPIRAKPGSVLRFRSSKTGEVVYATEVMHPGTTGVHMLARACAEVAGDADRIMRRVVADVWNRKIPA